MFCFVVLLSCAVGMDTFCLALVVVLIVIKSNSHICEIHYFSSVLALPFQMYGRYDSTSNFSKKPKLLFSVDLVLQFYFLCYLFQWVPPEKYMQCGTLKNDS